MVESNIGWIEKYHDPTNMRAIFQGWVAIVDKDRSRKYHNLVEKSEKIIPLLPWEKSLEKEKFLSPDFSSLNVLTFAGDKQPSGINVPNYSDIRENEGFKNVIFETSKVSNASRWEPMDFMTHSESDFFHEF